MHLSAPHFLVFLGRLGPFPPTCMYHRQTIKENMDMCVDIAVVDTAQRCRGVRKAQRQLRRNASPYNSPSMSNICITCFYCDKGKTKSTSSPKTEV